MVARLTVPLADQAIVAAARGAGLELAPVSAHSLVQRQQGLLLGFAGFSAERITRGCEQLARVMERAATSPAST